MHSLFSWSTSRGLIAIRLVCVTEGAWLQWLIYSTSRFGYLLLLQNEPLSPLRTNTAPFFCCCCYRCCSSSGLTMSLSLFSCHLLYLISVDCEAVFDLNCRRGKERMTLWLYSNKELYHNSSPIFNIALKILTFI